VEPPHLWATAAAGGCSGRANAWKLGVTWVTPEPAGEVIGGGCQATSIATDLDGLCDAHLIAIRRLKAAMPGVAISSRGR
jgi:hypothetical protein